MDGLLLEIPIAENDKEILENLLTKPETSSPPLESLSETAAKVLFELAINKVSLRDFFPENVLGDCPKTHGQGLKSSNSVAICIRGKSIMQLFDTQRK